jgi:hypothetical protein
LDADGKGAGRVTADGDVSYRLFAFAFMFHAITLREATLRDGEGEKIFSYSMF